MGIRKSFGKGEMAALLMVLFLNFFRLRRVGGREPMGHSRQRGDADDGSVGVPVIH